MRIRNKLLVAMAIPIGLVALQIALVNLSIRQLQDAVNFISSATSVIESNFIALEKVELLRSEIKQVPARFVSSQPVENTNDLPIFNIWNEVSVLIDAIGQSNAFTNASTDISTALLEARNSASTRITNTLAVVESPASDMDSLLEAAIFAERDLVGLSGAINGLIVELRQQLQEAVELERRIHNRPVIAGIVVGGLAILVIVALAWLYVDRHLVARLSALSKAMLAISGGNLRAEIPVTSGGDEVGEMADALKIFRDTAVEVEEKNLRQIADARQRLIDAIETISEGFSLYDKDDLLVLSNRQYGELLHPGLGKPIEPGVEFETLIRQVGYSGQVEDARGREEDWIAGRLERHADPEGMFLQQRHDGRWIEITEHKTAEGGTVAIYTDITQQKQAEAALVEAKNRAEEAAEQVTQQNTMLESLSSKLSKYLSPQVYSSIFRGDQGVEIASKRKKLTIMFSDIAGFTETTDLLESEELTSLLNNYLTEMSNIALEYGATIDKYIGDAIMLFFGDPESQGAQKDALACVKMAITMQEKMQELQTLWLDRGMENPFRLRIGINTGYCTVGNFGSEDRMDYTIIGSEVNLAERLESLAEPGGILISHETYSLVKKQIDVQELDPRQLKGFAKPVRNYQVKPRKAEAGSESTTTTFKLGDVEINLDETSMSASQRKKTVATLKKIISRLG